MTLTNENYYSNETNREYMSVSQYKQFQKCEAAAMAQIKGEWQIGDHRARISDVTEKRFNSGNEGYEITLEISGYNSNNGVCKPVQANTAQKPMRRVMF